MKEFSERENAILKIIGNKRTPTIKEISKKLFKKDELLDPDIAVANSITRIIKKCEHHELGWTLLKMRENGKLIIWRA
mgnify:CR=1 FL=1